MVAFLDTCINQAIGVYVIPWRSIVHYGLHFIAPLLLALLFGKERWLKAYFIMISTMIVDVDHLFATPIFDPNRMSIGFHPLHSYYAIAIYVLMCILPYNKIQWPWWLRAIGIGLVFHMITDLQDYVLWL